MTLQRTLWVAMLGWFLASMAAAQCWECEDKTDADGNPVYPGVECAGVSVSDAGMTECHVVTNPGRCVFEDLETGQPGEPCERDPFPGNGHTSPPEQGCESSSLQNQPDYQITPNGEAADDWTPEIPALTTAVG